MFCMYTLSGSSYNGLASGMGLLWQLDDFKSDKAASKDKLNQDPSLLALLIYSIYGSVDL